MNKIVRYLPLAALLFTAACTDWDDHYDASASGEGSQLTLWQAIEQNPKLSDFSQVMQKTKVFRQHKKTSVSYADLLSGGQTFTVLAPVNGTFNKDSLLALIETAQGDSSVERTFVLNHLSRHAVSDDGQPQEMMLANGKRITIGAGKVGEVNITSANNRQHNGVLHVVERQVPCAYNLYEAMSNLPQFAAVGGFLRQYEEDEFDESASLSSGTVDGVPVYVDSVVVERNRMLDRIGLINAEDSTYYMVVPSTAGWQKAWDEALAHFNYDSTVEKRDSIQQFWANYSLLKDAIFSRTVQASPQDSLISKNYNRKEPKYSVFYHPFTTGIMSQYEQLINCSNGYLYQTAEWPFRPEEIYFREVKVQGENSSAILDYSGCEKANRTLSADSISEGGYLDITASSKLTPNWNVTFKLTNTLAGYYDICAVVLPESVFNTVDPSLKPRRFSATINYVDENGMAQSDNCGGKTFTADPLRVDTVVVAKAFRLPVCNYDQVNNKISVKLSCKMKKSEVSKYNSSMFLDCIYLRPTTKEE